MPGASEAPSGAQPMNNATFSTNFAEARPAAFANPLFEDANACTEGPLLERPPGAQQLAAQGGEAGQGDLNGRAELASPRQKALQSWFPLRNPLLRTRGGTGRQTSNRAFKLELRLPEDMPASLPLLQDVTSTVTGSAGSPAAIGTPRVLQRLRQAPPAQQPVLDGAMAALLQQAAAARRTVAARRAGSGRQATRRKLDVRLPPVAAPPTPYLPTPEVLAAPSPLPGTPASALRRGSLLRSALRSARKSASYGTPMEGVPERFGFVLQPKTPALDFTPVEGVLERQGPLLPATGFKRPLAVAPGMRQVRATLNDAATSPLGTPGWDDAGARLRAAWSPGESAVLATGVAACGGGSDAAMKEAGDQDSPVEGLVAPPSAAAHTGAHAGGSPSGSFAFSAAAPAAHAAGARRGTPEQNLLGFFAADGGFSALRRKSLSSEGKELPPQGGALVQQAVPQTPWRLRDYDPSPMVVMPWRHPLGQPALPCALNPSPPPQQPQQQLQDGVAASDDDDDGNTGGFDGDEYGDGGGSDFDDDGMGGDVAMENADPNNDADEAAAEGGEAEQGQEEEEEGTPDAGAAATPQQAQEAGAARRHGRPNSGNQRLKKEFRSRKSLAGVGLQATPHRSKRRSTRTSIKPLEWWRNERKVYERKFKSLPTVEHSEVHAASPRWQFVSDYRKLRTGGNQ